MKLKYNILWFEDDTDIINGKIGRTINQYLIDLGFIPEINHYVNGENLDKLLTKQYDLIISDLNLGEFETGDILINKIRECSIFTEVLLYSASSKHILQIIENNGRMIERISFSVGIKELSNKIKDIIHLTVKKVQDVCNMRGLVIAETIDLEAKIEEIVKNYFDVTKESNFKHIRNEVFNKICDKKVSQSEAYLNITRGIKDQDIHKLIDDDILTVYDLYCALQSILKAHEKDINIKINSSASRDEKFKFESEKEAIEKIRKKLVEFDTEIIKVRNTLAHVEEKVGIDGVPILESINKNGIPLCFNEEKYVEIRSDLNKHNANLQQIQEYLEKINTLNLAAVTDEV